MSTNNMAETSDQAVKLAGQLAECLNASGVNGTERLLVLSALITLLAEKVLVEHPDPHAEIHALKDAAARFGMVAMSEIMGNGDSQQHERGVR